MANQMTVFMGSKWLRITKSDDSVANTVDMSDGEKRGKIMSLKVNENYWTN